MNRSQEIKNYSLKLHAEANTISEHAEKGFTEFACQQLVISGTIEDYNELYFEQKVRHKNMKLNGYHLDNEKENLDLFVTYWTGSLQPIKVDDKIIKETYKSLQDFFRESLKRLSEDLRLRSEQYQISKLIYSNKKKILKVRLYVLTNGLSNIKDNDIPALQIEGLNVHNQIFDVERLYEYSTIGNVSTDIKIDFSRDFNHQIQCIGINNNPKDIKTYLAILPGDILYKLYEAYGSKLMELNVRSFLQVTGKINKGIKKTLDEDPEMFFSYNNGITATAEEIKFSTDQNGNKFISYLGGFQIVNGGQTTASIHRARKVDNINLDLIAVPAKISIINKNKLKDIVPSISRFSNSQNSVKNSDFHSDNEYLKQIEELSKIVFIPGETGKWYFERMRGDYQNDKFKADNENRGNKNFNDLTPTSRKFEKLEIAKYVNAWDQKPHFVCSGQQKNFIEFMEGHAIEALKNKIDENYFKDLVGKSILYRSVEKIIKKELKNLDNKSQITSYVVAVISKNVGNKFNFSIVWQDQKISKELEKAIIKWSKKISEKVLQSVPAGKNNLEFYKKGDFWKIISGITLSIGSLDVPKELRETKINSKSKSLNDFYSSEELSNIRNCKKISSNNWIKLNEWGQKTNSLNDEELGYTLTLSRMAKNNWSESPSSKIAEIGNTIIELAVEEGIL